MDSSNGNADYKLQAIKDAIENGTLTKEKINRRLTCAISEEYQKPLADRDSQFILACEKILYEMHTGKPYVSPKEVYQQALLDKTLNMTGKNVKRTSRVTWRIAIASCILLVLTFAADVLLHREWIEGNSTKDEQQYIISGESSNLDTLPSGVADAIPTTQSIQTNELGKVKEILGFMPEVISIPLQGWSLDYYSVVVSPSNSTFSATYENDKYENAFLFSIKYYSDIENAQNWIEQNKQGKHISIGGKEVYFAENIENNVCFWSSGSTCYSLFGPISQEELIPIIASIQGEYEND